jgi:hypothetical protein
MENQEIESRKPKSRIVDLGSGALNPSMTRDQYVELFFGAKLKNTQKQVLMYLAFRFNFKEKNPTKMSIRRAANDLDMNKSTFIKYKKELADLGWLKIQKGFNNNPDKITLLIGNEIPELTWKEAAHKKTQLDLDAEAMSRKTGSFGATR